MTAYFTDAPPQLCAFGQYVRVYGRNAESRGVRWSSVLASFAQPAFSCYHRNYC